MASSKVNKCNFRKRKLESDFIFEVNDDDCSQSPPSSPKNTDNQIKIISESAKTNSVIQKEVVDNEKSNLEAIENVDEESRAVLCCSESNKVIILSTEVKNNVETKSEVMAGNSTFDNLGANDKFLFSLKFRDKNFADLYRKDIISAIMNCLDFKIHEELDEVGLKVKFWESNKSASDMEITSESEPENLELPDSLFVVDTTPSNKNSISSQPKFYSRTKYVIDDEEKLQVSEKDTQNKRFCNPSSCFNCNGLHALKDCKEPKNYKKINAARNRHKEMKSAKNTRYHLEDEQKYGHLGPGKISQNLREALGLWENEIPPYVYHMRRLGYPLGWLEASKKTTSTLELYDFNGKNQNTKNDDLLYDLEKVIEYAGFNAPLPKGAKDLHSRYNCPPYSEKHSVKYMLEHLKRQLCTTTKVEKLDENSQNSNEGNNSSKEPSRSGSPTLTDLELQKKQLLDMLNNGITLETPDSEAKKISLEQLDIETPPSIVKSSSFGTPVLKNFSPFEKLPNPDNFSVGVSQVINFENLPDSTGKYEQMTNVLDKVRKTIRFSNGGQPPKNNDDHSTT